MQQNKKPNNFKKGYFDHNSLTVKFGNEYCKPEHRFIADAIKVPDYKYQVYERADAGGGCYYGYKEWNEYTQKNAYIIIRNGEIIGWMNPYHGGTIKSELYPFSYKFTHEKIKEFARQINLLIVEY